MVVAQRMAWLSFGAAPFEPTTWPQFVPSPGHDR